MKHVYLFLLLLLHSGTSLAQSLVSDVRIRMLDGARLEILYNLNSPADSIWIEAEARYGGALYPSSRFLYGDVGRQIRAGNNRRIVWYLYDEGQRIKSDVRVKVFALPPDLPLLASIDSNREPLQPQQIIKEAPDAIALYPSLKDKPQRSVGPGWAGLSALLPGMGNMFVHRNSFGKPELRVGLRPLVTVGFYGLLLYRMNQKRLSGEWYTRYTQQKNPAEGEAYYEVANQYHHRAYIATRVAAVIWATDVTLTFLRGLGNRRYQPKERKIKVIPDIQGKTPVAKIRVRL